MILVDANLLLYGKISSYPQHQVVRPWLEAQLGGSDRVGLPWLSLLAFLRLSTSPRVLAQPLSMSAAWAQVREWLARPCAFVPTPTDRHETIFDELVRKHALTAALVNDAHLATLAIEHGLLLCSADQDFARFDQLRWHDPTAPG